MLRGIPALLVVLLGAACQPAKPVLVDVPAPARSASPNPDTDREELQRQLDAADAAFFEGKYPVARQAYEAAWERSRPHPLTLVMASHAASESGDAPGAEALAARAREEAQGFPKSECRGPTPALVRIDRPGAAWVVDTSVFRTDLRRHRQLYGFCGRGMVSGRAVAPAAVGWAPTFRVGRWETGPDAEAKWTVEHVTLRDIVYGTAAIRLSHSIVGWSFNEGYDGAIAYSADRTLAATGANRDDKEVRVWRAADGSLVKALDYDRALRDVHAIVFSPDASLLAAADCDHIVIWEVASGQRLARIRPSSMQCVYGGGIGNPVERMVFSRDNNLFAATYVVQGPPGNPVPADDAGNFLAVHQTRGGALVRRYRDAPREIEAFTPDNRAIVGLDAVFDLDKGQGSKLDEKTGAGSPATTDWLASYRSIVELGPGSRAEKFAIQWDLEEVGPYSIPKKKGETRNPPN